MDEELLNRNKNINRVIESRFGKNWTFVIVKELINSIRFHSKKRK